MNYPANRSYFAPVACFTAVPLKLTLPKEEWARIVGLDYEALNCALSK